MVSNPPTRMHNMLFPLSSRISGVEYGDLSPKMCIRVAQKIKVVMIMGADAEFKMGTHDCTKVFVGESMA